MYFAGVFAVAMLLAPAGNGTHAAASLRHRKLFAKLALLAACLVAFGGAATGYPQGLCNASCRCGTCLRLSGGKLANDGDTSLDLAQGPTPRRNLRESSSNDASTPNVTTTKTPCSIRETAKRISRAAVDARSNNTNSSLSCVGPEAVDPPRLCSIKNPDQKGRKAIFLVPDTSQENANTANVIVGALDLMFSDYIFSDKGNEELTHELAKFALTSADGTCSKQLHVDCSIFDDKVVDWKAVFGTSTILPALCDRFYGFCDRKNVYKKSCPDTVCCQLCSTINLLTCANNDRNDTMTALFEGIFGISVDDTKTVAGEVFSSELKAYGLNAEMLEAVEETATWVFNVSLSVMNTKAFGWSKCMSICTKSIRPRLAPWYGIPHECLPREHRAREDDGNTTVGLNGSGLAQQDAEDSVCECDELARAWSTSVLVWHGIAVFGAVVLVGLQVWIALMVDLEEFSHEADRLCCCCCRRDRHYRRLHPCCCTRRLVLSSVGSLLLVGCLVTQLTFITSGSRGASCSNGASKVSASMVLTEGAARENDHFMSSWVVLSAVMFWIIMYAFVVPNMRAAVLRGAAVATSSGTSKASAGASSKSRGSSGSSTTSRPGRLYKARVLATLSAEGRGCTKCKDAHRAYNDAFSFSRGSYYLYMRLVSEMVEAGNQTGQLISFSHERPYTWIVSLSTVLVLNGLSLSAPFVAGRCIPTCNREIRFILAAADSLFDVCYLLLAVIFSEKRSFGGSGTWVMAVLGILVPITSLTRRQFSMARSFAKKDDGDEAMKGGVVRRVEEDGSGAAGSRRRGGGRVPIGAAERIGSDNDTAQMAVSSSSNSGKVNNRVMVLVSFLCSAYYIACGSVFLRMAYEGDAACRNMLGDTLWEGSKPQYVITAQPSAGLGAGSSLTHLRGFCNFTAITSIHSSSAGLGTATPPLVRLPPALARLERLESLVLFGHNIASDGVPARILDGVALPKLTRLEFGKGDPVLRDLDLTASGAYLEVFPLHVLRFMNDLESLRLRDTNISCFPPRRNFHRMRKLRALDLRGTRITYLPPSVLYEHPLLLDLNLLGTPVSRSLDWSDHALGSTVWEAATAEDRRATYHVFDWSRLARTLPMLEHLNASGNGLNASTHLNGMDLNAWRHLASLDVSNNPDLMPAAPAPYTFSWWQVLSDHPTLMNSTHVQFIGLANVGLAPEHVNLQRVGETAAKHNATTPPPLTCRQLQWIARTMSGTPGSRVDLSRNDKLRLFHPWSELRRDMISCNCATGANCSYVDAAVFRLALGLLPNMQSLTITKQLFQPKFQALIGDGIISLAQIFKQGARLSSLTLRQNEMSGSLASVAFETHAPNLEVIQLDSNHLTGTLPKSLFKLTKLVSLKLDSNDLSGSIPPEISALERLEQLDLRQNGLIGAIPKQVFALVNLKKFDISKNTLSGPLSGHISALRHLLSLDLSRNKLSGAIPSEISALSMLGVIDASRNNFSGTIPASIGSLVRLTRLFLGGNSLRGSIPMALAYLTNLVDIDLSRNQLDGNIPNNVFGALVRLEGRLDLSSNQLVGTIPLRLSALTRLSMLDLSRNQLVGTIPLRLSALTRLSMLDLSRNQLVGTIPGSLSALTQLSMLDLSGNKLVGTIPGSLSALTRLSMLNLSGNQLVGTIPLGLRGILCENPANLTVYVKCNDTNYL